MSKNEGKKNGKKTNEKKNKTDAPVTVEFNSESYIT